MNELQINSELLSADARGKKHIPVAVFAVIMIHVVLFIVLLIAAGCRASARAKVTMPIQETALRLPLEQAPPTPHPVKTVMATEPVVEPELPRTVAQTIKPDATRQAQRSEARTIIRPVSKSSSSRVAPVYVVQSGDSVERIAKRHGTTVQAIKTANNLKSHVIHPGQRLRLKAGGRAHGSPLQVKTSKPKRSNEV
jgi:LysM repeat protein